jgi:dolichol-phosphate mannosyltransferase
MNGKAPDRERSLVIVPTYNEIESIEEVAQRLFAAVGEQVDLLVVDDGSPDGTADFVKRLAAERPRMHLIERSGKQGLGTAYVAGFRWAIERGYDAVVEMDADLSHDPADVPRLLQRLGEVDLAVGSRYVPGGRVVNWGKIRRILSLGGNLYARMWLGFPVRDSTSGFRAYRTAALAAGDLGALRSEGYSFQIEMTRRIHRSGGRIAEVPITFVERERGKSKMSRRIVIEAMVGVTRWGLRDRFTRRREGTAG